MDCEARLIRRVITDNGITVVCGGKELAHPYMDATLSDLATSMSMPMAGERSDHVSMWRQLKSMGAAFTANDVPVRDATGDNILIDIGQEEPPIGSYSLHEGISQNPGTPSQEEGGPSKRKAKRYVMFCLIPQVELDLTKSSSF